MNGSDRQYIRRFAKKNAVRNDRTVLARAFEPRDGETALSFTLRDESLQSQDQLFGYQAHFKIEPSGDLPGLCFLTHQNLIEDLKPPLPPRQRNDETDPVYGKLHYETNLPTEEQRHQMAAQATQNNQLLPAKIKGKYHPP